MQTSKHTNSQCLSEKRGHSPYELFLAKSSRIQEVAYFQFEIRSLFMQSHQGKVSRLDTRCLIFWRLTTKLSLLHLVVHKNTGIWQCNIFLIFIYKVLSICFLNIQICSIQTVQNRRRGPAKIVLISWNIFLFWFTTFLLINEH